MATVAIHRETNMDIDVVIHLCAAICLEIDVAINMAVINTCKL